jgi:hypothetical protein
MIIAAEAALCNALLKDRVDFRALFNGGSQYARAGANPTYIWFNVSWFAMSLQTVKLAVPKAWLPAD